MFRNDLDSHVRERPMGAEQRQDHLGEQPDLVCPECGGTYEADDVICPHCGVSLVGG